MSATYKLFVYGTLANRDYFQIITGKDLPRRPAALGGFQRIATQRAFPYIVPAAGCTVEGVLIEEIDREVLAHLDQYEDNGRLYTRRPVWVLAGSEEVIAYAYVGNPDAIAERFGLEMEQAERVERHLDTEIDAVLVRSAQKAQASTSELDIRARRELMGDTIEALRHSHFANPSWSPYVMRYSLERTALPSLAWLRDEPQAEVYARNYLDLIARLVVFNQVEGFIRGNFRNAVRVQDPYYHHTVSVLAAFTLLNEHADLFNIGIHQAGLDIYDQDREYLDYVRDALLVADSLCDHDAAAGIINNINNHRQVGGTPMGAELEFASLGRRAIGAAAGADPLFDGFYYFHDFDLARRLWKVGGYVDDHTGVTFDESRSRGFLELAFGRLRVGGDLSRPATHDVWILAELIRQATAFITVPPHSMHVSFQADPDRPFTRLENPRFLYCLLLLGGDFGPDEKGVLREKRLYQKETVNPHTGLDFSRLNSHRANENDPKPKSVVEFTFARLSRDRSYEPFILALKGFQWATNPMPLDFSDQCPYRAYHRRVERDLMSWAKQPQPLSDDDLGGFLQEVERGLHLERTSGAGHSPGYIASAVARIESLLQQRNQAIRESTLSADSVGSFPRENP